MAILGTAVNFGFAGTSNGLTETTTTVLNGKFLLQSVDVSKAADEEQVRDSSGALVSRNFYNAHSKATLEYIVKGASLTAARSNSTVPAAGTLINISACADMPDLVSTHWVVTSEPKISGSNTSGKRVTLALESHDNVTAAAT